jgi:hypothetical protein
MLKTSLEMVTNQYRYAEDRFERLRSHAESKLAEQVKFCWYNLPLG